MLETLIEIKVLIENYDDNYLDIENAIDRLKGHVQAHIPKWVYFYQQLEKSFLQDKPFRRPIYEQISFKPNAGSWASKIVGYEDELKHYVKELFKFPENQRVNILQEFKRKQEYTKNFTEFYNKIDIGLNMLSKWGKLDYSDAGVEKYIKEIGI